MKIKVTNYELTGTHIIACVSNETTEIDYKIDRQEFEDWLTDGTGVVDMGITHYDGDMLQEVSIKEPIADYWLQGEEINNSPVLDHIRLFIGSNKLICLDVETSLMRTEMYDLVKDFPTEQWIKVSNLITDYGMKQFERGVKEHAKIVTDVRALNSEPIVSTESAA